MDEFDTRRRGLGPAGDLERLFGKRPDRSLYRRYTTSAAAPKQSQIASIATGNAENDIELLAFLTSPGVLKITIGAKTFTQNAAAGIVSFKIPSQAGTPVFTLSRNGTDAISLTGGVQIYGSSGLPTGVQDLTYWSGSAS